MLAFLQRSRTCSISLSACLSRSLRGTSGCILDSIPPSCHGRLRRLDVRLEASDIFTQLRLHFPAPALQVLTLQCEIYNGVNICHHPTLFQGETTSLKAMALLHVRHWLPGNRFPNLIHLNISYFFMEELPLTVLTHLLANCPRLESLHLGQVWSYARFDLDVAPPARPVQLLNLRSLSSCCATLQAISALIAALILPKDIRIRIHDSPVQQHTTARENILPSLDFMRPLTTLELAADNSRLYLLAESDDGAAAVWIQATWDGREPSVWHDWLGYLHEMLALPAVRTFHVSVRDWTVVPPLLERMTALAGLGIMAIPDDHVHEYMVSAICAVLEHSGPIACPDLATLSIQLNSTPSIRDIIRMAARRAEYDCTLTHLILDNIHLPGAMQETISLDEHEQSALAVYVEDVRIGGGGICKWEQRSGWDVQVEHWRLPKGDEPHSVFPWGAGCVESRA
ncbi:hypothetical protein C8Q80DRAFT_1105471 [Daedaleopsis nitida]|nr:hypothetical protein C8Q80DRAFT_1105471 [Daedaleopsis nitida]